jgi:hypothetical protein
LEALAEFLHLYQANDIKLILTARGDDLCATLVPQEEKIFYYFR